MYTMFTSASLTFSNITRTFYKKSHNPLSKLNFHAALYRKKKQNKKKTLLHFVTVTKTHTQSNTRKTIKVCFLLLEFGDNKWFVFMSIG